MNYQALAQLLDQNPEIVITSHRSPDGDALGSSLAMYHFLQQRGCTQVQVVLPDAFPPFLNWMKDSDKVLLANQNKELAAQKLASAQVIFCLDYNTLSRMGDDMAQWARENTHATKVLIDHHRQPDNFEPFMLSDISASSTCELVYDFMVALGGKHFITLDIANCLYAGIMTDTGSFRFSSTGSKTHRIAAEFIELGLQPDQIYTLINDTNSIHRLRLMGYVLSEKLQVLEAHGVAFMSLSKEEQDRFHYRNGDTEGLVNYGLSVEGVRLAAFFREAENGEKAIKISFRSKDKVDVNTFARTHFNGGGHLNAAGGKSTLSLDETLARFLSAIPEYMKQY